MVQSMHQAIPYLTSMELAISAATQDTVVVVQSSPLTLRLTSMEPAISSSTQHTMVVVQSPALTLHLSSMETTVSSAIQEIRVVVQSIQYTVKQYLVSMEPIALLATQLPMAVVHSQYSATLYFVPTTLTATQ